MSFRNAFASIVVTGNPGGQRITINSTPPANEIDIYSGNAAELTPARILVDGVVNPQFRFDTADIAGVSGFQFNVRTGGVQVGSLGIGKCATVSKSLVSDESSRQFIRGWNLNTTNTPLMLQGGSVSGTTDATGHLAFVFVEAFAGILGIACTPITDVAMFLTISALSTTGFTVHAFNAAGSLNLTAITFRFICYGT